MNVLQKIKNFFLNDKIILGFIVLNLIVALVQDSGFEYSFLKVCDILITVIFLIEMLVKISTWGLKKYCQSRWNQLDGVLVLVSLPSLVNFFLPTGLWDLSILLTIRTLRIFRSFRIVKYFPNVKKIAAGLKLALRDTFSVFGGFLVLIIVVALINCTLFRNVAPEFFATPLDSIYSVFRLFTVEGWYEIPDTIADFYNGNSLIKHGVKIYFCFLLIGGGIIGMSFVNSIFVDAMVSDNNDDLNAEVNQLNDKIDTLTKKIEDLTKKLEDSNGRTQ